MQPELRGRWYPFSVQFDGSSCPARIGGKGEVPGLYVDLGRVEHLVAGDHPLLGAVAGLLERVEDLESALAYSKAIILHFRNLALLAGNRSASTPPETYISTGLEGVGALSGCREAVPTPPQPFLERSEALDCGIGRGAAPEHYSATACLGSSPLLPCSGQAAFLPSDQAGTCSGALPQGFGVEHCDQPDGFRVDREGQPLISPSGAAAFFVPSKEPR